ncbi:MAG: McrB family protein [Halanaerobiales bacterium]
MSQLDDLNELCQMVSEKSSHFKNRDIKLPKVFRDKYKEFREAEGSYTVTWYEYTTKIITPENKKIFCPNQWFYLASFAVPLYDELEKYKEENVRVFTNNNDLNFKEFVKNFRNIGKDIDESNYNNYIDKVKEQIEEIDSTLLQKIKEFLNYDEDDIDRFLLFLTNKEWWNSGKAIYRGDYHYSPINNSLGVLHETQGFIPQITKDLANNEDILLILSEQETNNEIDSSFVGVNRIIYGPPGTGKSYKLKEEYEDVTSKDNVQRVTFHPEYTYHDFVGSYKPVPLYNKKKDEKVFTLEDTDLEDGKPVPVIDYQFVSGPFTRLLTKAYNNTDQEFTLIIEELNRANAPAVFGDLFQLLDRDKNGRSEFDVIPDPELLKHIINETDTEYKSIRLPENLNIVATMNSADQGVFVLDSAFKRRWNFEYLPITFEGVEHASEKVKYCGVEIAWQSFVEQINSELAKLQVNEDRHIGPYFLKKGEPSDPCLVANKLLTYLWDDVVRYRRSDFFNSEIKTFGDLFNIYGTGEVKDNPVFKFKLKEEKINNTVDNIGVDDEDEV